MPSVHTIKSTQILPVSIETAWKFFSDPHNLLTITPPFLNLKVTNEIYGEEVYAGQVITYTVRPLLGIPLPWMTEITHVEKGKLFVDEQRQGPYSIWHHQHHFKAVTGGVEMTDLVHYKLPLGFIGNLANGPLVKGKLRQIFGFRYTKVVALFGPPPDGRMELTIR